MCRLEATKCSTTLERTAGGEREKLYMKKQTDNNIMDHHDKSLPFPPDSKRTIKKTSTS